MNSKLVKAGVAGAAVVAIAVSGSTFAAWSDFGEESTGAGAGMLKLNVGEQGATSAVEPFSLAPGQNEYRNFYLASADADNVPNGTLTAKIQNLDDIEDGCTTASEKVAEGGNGCGSEGELIDEAIVTVQVSGPVRSAADCAAATYGRNISGSLDFIETQLLQFGEIVAGEGRCIQTSMTLPFASSTNASQGDSASWDWRFELEQVTP